MHQGMYFRWFLRFFSGFLLICTQAVYAGGNYASPHHVSAETCGACHKDIYSQWKTSMHAQSSPLKNPVHGNVYKKMVGKPLEENLKLKDEYPVCLQCHAPNAAKDKKTKLDEQNYAEGVNCVVCHTLKKFKGLQDENGKPLFGLEAYEMSATHLQGPSGRYLSPEANAFHPFPMEPNQGMLRTSRVCMGCHGQYNNAEGVPMCQTGVEYAKNAPVTCQSCHMPKINGTTLHNFLGGHSESMVKRAMVVTLTAEPTKTKIRTVVRLQNMLPHNFPTGIPLRYAYMKLTAYDKTDNLVWGNFKTFPPNRMDDPDAMFVYRVGDENGKEADLPFEGKKILSNNRFIPNEVRELEYELPLENIAIIRAELIFHLLPASFIEKFDDGNLTGDLTSPVVAGIAEIKMQ